MKTECTSRGELLAAAVRIAEDEGPAAVTVRRVAEAAGVAQGTVYHYYPAKDELMADVIEFFWQSVLGGGDDAGDQDFESFFSEFYRRAAQGLRRFKTEFLSQMADVRLQTRTFGRRREAAYQAQLRVRMAAVLRNDARIRPGVWTAGFTPERFAALMMNEALSALRAGQESPAFLCELTERLLYKN